MQVRVPKLGHSQIAEQHLSVREQHGDGTQICTFERIRRGQAPDAPCSSGQAQEGQKAHTCRGCFASTVCRCLFWGDMKVAACVARSSPLDLPRR